jgi:hypothetical protein
MHRVPHRYINEDVACDVNPEMSPQVVEIGTEFHATCSVMTRRAADLNMSILDAVEL